MTSGSAQDREQLAIGAARRFGDVVRETPELKIDPSLLKLRAALLKEPHEFFKRLRDRLQAEPATTSESLTRLADASFALAYLTNEIGDKEDAMRAYQESLAIRQRLARDFPANTEFQRALAAVHTNIAGVEAQTGQVAKGLESLSRSRAILSRLVQENPSDFGLEHDLARSHNAIGALEKDLGRLSDAEKSYELARDILDRLAREHPDDAGTAAALAGSYYNMGLLQMDAGRPADALRSYKQACVLRERLARQSPADTELQNDLAASYLSMAILRARAAGRQRPWPRMSMSARSGRGSRPRTRRLRNIRAISRSVTTGSASSSWTRAVRRRPWQRIEHARAIFERLARDNPSVTQFRRYLAGSELNIGRVQTMTNRPADALESYEKSRRIRRASRVRTRR